MGVVRGTSRGAGLVWSAGNVIKWWEINGFCITGLQTSWSRVTEGRVRSGARGASPGSVRGGGRDQGEEKQACEKLSFNL